MKDIRLTDGSILNIKINFLTIKLLADLNIEKLAKEIDDNPSDKKNIDLAGKIIYAIIRSNGRRVDEEEAMMLVPADDTVLAQLFFEFKEKMEVFKKKQTMNM